MHGARDTLGASTAIGAQPLEIVTPIYEDRDASSRLFLELARVLRPLPYIVAVDDGSVHQPISQGSLESANLTGEVLRRKRNVGHQRAIAIGLSQVAEMFPAVPWIIAMDSDGEDLPSTIPILIDTLTGSEADLVVAERRNRVETARFKAMYWAYK